MRDASGAVAAYPTVRCAILIDAGNVRFLENVGVFRAATVRGAGRGMPAGPPTAGPERRPQSLGANANEIV